MRKWTIGVLAVLIQCGFLSLLSTSSSGVDILPPTIESIYEGSVALYDLKSINSPARYDTFFYTSSDHKPVRSEYDLNDDGLIDFTREWIRIKRVIIQKQDQNFDGKWDLLRFEYKKYIYEFRDTDFEGRYDVLDIVPILDDSGERKSYSSLPEINKSDDIDLLVSCLEKMKLDEHQVYVLGETFGPAFGSVVHFSRKEQWDQILATIREHLDLPSNDELPLTLDLMTEDEAQLTKKRALLLKDFTTIKAVKLPLSEPSEFWLSAVSHEVIRAYLAKRLFFELNTDPKVTWNDFLTYHKARVDGKSIGFIERIRGGSFTSDFYETYLKKYKEAYLFDELEAHLYSALHTKYYYMLSYRSVFTYADFIYTRALYELIQEKKLSCPTHIAYFLLEKDIQKFMPYLKTLPKAEVDEAKEEVKQSLSKLSF